MFEIINRSSFNTFLQAVKLDHILWKNDVYHYIRNESELDASDFSDHTESRFGQWYYGESKKQFSNEATFIALEQPHKSVHLAGLGGIEASDAGNKDKALQQLKIMESESKMVIEKLCDLESFFKNESMNEQGDVESGETELF